MVHRFLRAAGTFAAALVFLAGCDSADSSGFDAGPAALKGNTSLPSSPSDAAALAGDVQGPDFFIPGCVTRYTIDPAGEAGGTWIVPTGATLISTGILSNGHSYADYSLPNVQKVGITWRSNQSYKAKIVYRTTGSCSVID